MPTRSVLNRALGAFFKGALPGAAVGFALPYGAAIAFWPSYPYEAVLGQMLAGALFGAVAGASLLAVIQGRGRGRGRGRKQG